MAHTPAPWKFEPMEGFEDLHKLRGTTPELHEGYFRSNGGDWSVGYADGRICMVDFKGKARRGQGYLAPDPEGMANARLIAAAPDLLEALKETWRELIASGLSGHRNMKAIHEKVCGAIAKAEGR